MDGESAKKEALALALKLASKIESLAIQFEEKQTWIDGQEADDGVTAVGNGDGILDGSVDQISANEAVLVHFFDLVQRHVGSDPVHADDAKRRAVNMKRVSGVESETCKRASKQAS